MEWGIAGNIEFIHGRLKVGEAMSPPLIKKVKQEIHSDGIAIVDAPPGTSCPMIATITDSDFVLLVTEPTPFGLNDLELAVEAVRAVKKPCGIVINRSDVGDDRIKIYAEKEGIPIFLEIPEIRKIAEAYSRGEMIINAIPEMKKDFQRLYDDIAQIVQGVQK
jgi:MinD superfamily P-loop ATPase